jgi:hypothetical protein
MDQQAIFDKVAEHLIRQGERAMSPSGEGTGACAYRGQNGTKCAIGCLIDDKFYESRFEGHGIYNHAVRHAVSRSLGIELDSSPRLVSILSALQDIHDHSKDFSKIPAELKIKAAHYGLASDIISATLQDVATQRDAATSP